MVRIAKKGPGHTGVDKTPRAVKAGKENEAVFEDESEILRKSAAENFFMTGKAIVTNKARRGRRGKNDESSDEENVETNEEKDEKQISLPALSKYEEEVTRRKAKEIRRFAEKFEHWKMLIMASEYNICFLGAGPKKSLMDAFMEGLTKEGETTVCFEGYKEEATARNILAAFAEFFKIKKATGRHLNALATQITDCLETMKETVYVFLHNIDSTSLRDPADQEALATLASTPWLRLCASIDHNKATALWDTRITTLFNWYFIRADTFDCCLPALIASKSNILGLNPKHSHSAHTLSSLDILWESLAENAKKIFKLFFSLTYSTGQSVGFWDLFREARDEFLVSSDAALRQLLVEFEDHRVLSRRRRDDGNENLIACLDRQLVERFFQEKGISLDEE